MRFRFDHNLIICKNNNINLHELREQLCITQKAKQFIPIGSSIKLNWEKLLKNYFLNESFRYLCLWDIQRPTFCKYENSLNKLSASLCGYSLRTLCGITYVFCYIKILSKYDEWKMLYRILFNYITIVRRSNYSFYIPITIEFIMFYRCL